MRVLPAILALLCAASSALAFRDYFNREEVLALARTYRNVGVQVIENIYSAFSAAADICTTCPSNASGLEAKGKGQVSCVNRNKGILFRNEPVVVNAQNLRTKVRQLKEEVDALKKAGKADEAKQKQKELDKANKDLEAAEKALKPYTKNGCSEDAAQSKGYASSHNCNGKSYYCVTASQGSSCCKLSNNKCQFEGGECFL